MIDLPTTCGFCSCGCALYVEPVGSRIVALCPSATHPVSTGRLCIKGWNATPALTGEQRLRTPLIRKGDSLEPATWEEAITLTATKLKQVSSESGPTSIGIIGSAKTTNEECYSLVKLARGVIGTPNIDSACRFYDASLIPALLDTTGVPASQIDLNSITSAGSMLIVGANVMDQLAHVGSRIQDAADNGCKVVVADSRVSRLAPQASMFLKPKPGTDLAWLRVLIRTIIDQHLYADEAERLPGFEELSNSVRDADGKGLIDECEVSGEDVVDAAEILAKNGPVVVMFGLGVLQQPESTRIVKALADVALLLNGYVMPLRGQNNAQGACDLGLAHDLLPGYMPLYDSGAKAKWEWQWKCELPSDPGMDAARMVSACGTGELKALLIFGENVALSAPNTHEAIKALDKVGFLAVADMYLTETAQLADVVFPACSFLEKDGTFTNIERRVQRVRKMIEPVGESWSDLSIISALASALGGSVSDDPAEVMAEIAANVGVYEAVSYAALDESWGHQWPMVGAMPQLAPVPATEAQENPDYPMRLIASRINFHQQTGTLASRSPVLAREYPNTFAELSSADAERLKLRPGSQVKISSKAGSLTRRLILSDSVPAGSVHVPLFFGGDSPNSLASGECDPVSGVPIYKGCAVSVEAVK
ncbi:MAG: molybdopterin-dependent oxidoreductase [Armatimonadetes bacterium]|nr:molybdopterin-dependent oxidoreductase [Armatimonadota bacterium]